MSVCSLYFAYGSNMHLGRMRTRVPSAKTLGRACLDAHRLVFHKTGRDGSAKCDIVATAPNRGKVWGVLYQIAHEERSLLDAEEGLDSGYTIKRIWILYRRRLIRAFCYLAQAHYWDPNLRPFDWYHGLVVAGARMHLLPATYTRWLEGFETVSDPDTERWQHARSITNPSAQSRHLPEFRSRTRRRGSR